MGVGGGAVGVGVGGAVVGVGGAMVGVGVAAVVGASAGVAGGGVAAATACDRPPAAAPAGVCVGVAKFWTRGGATADTSEPEIGMP